MKSIKSVKILVILITTLSILSGTLNKIFPSLIAFPDLTNLLSLQINSFSHLKLWQFITHMLFYPAPSGIHIFYLINLFFGIMILQRFGTAVAIHQGEKRFLQLFFTCGIISGIVAFLTMSYSNTPSSYAGPTSALYTLLIAIIFLFPQLELMTPLTSTVKGKTLVPVLMGMMLLINLSAGNYTHFFAILSASITAYLYILLFWKKESPYLFMHKFDHAIINLSGGKLETLLKNTRLDSYTNKSRIYDIHTGKAILSEEKFINACLEKISKEGKSSLTLYERFRLHRYSKKALKR